ncbi:MAG TPA: penicillin-binding protein 2 [Blastocatellia bacterium]|jgi:penicillin-binding protein 2|nr:penicillin-binding protein 2 [Blastocatellia bacterium]
MASDRNQTFDPTEDLRQAGLRLQIIHYLAIALFGALIARLWYLQVMNSQDFAGRAEANRIRVIPIPARRGTIFDRKGNVLVTSKASFNIVLSREDIKDSELPQIADLLAQYLEIDRQWLAKRFEDAKYGAQYESIVIKELASPTDIAWVRAHEYDYPMIRVEEAPQRLYLYGQLAAHALGYVGEVSPEELKKPNGPFSKDRGYKLGDIIGKFGIESKYNDILMGKDGERRVLVDSRGRIQPKGEIERIDPVPGRDLYTTLDLDIQKVAEAQADAMPAGRGAIAVMDPNNGEVLAMVSHPAFDPNIFSQRAKTPEGKEEIRELYEDPDKPLYNRVIQGGFPPGSTWKLLTTVAALNEGTITPEQSRVQDGPLQVGNYLMHSISHLGQPTIHDAIVHSADGYFYRLGIKLGVEKFEKWVDLFHFGERTGIDLPNERAGTPPIRQTKLREYEWQIKKVEKQLEEATDKTFRAQLEFRIKQLQHEAQWSDYDMASSAFGQGRNASTPVQLLRYVGALANGGHLHTPHLLLRAVSGIDRNGKEHAEVRYEDSNAFDVPMSDTIHKIVVDGMYGVVNEAGGTGGNARVEGFDVCGKTGTAQVASKDKAGAKNKDHAWFISFAPRDKPEISSVILTENVGFGSTFSAPRAQAIYEDYYRRTRGLGPKPAETKAENGGSGDASRSPERKPDIATPTPRL